ncbi:MAG: AmmeMemoRadiSam system radical SAM enzyme [Acidobacteriota bacterium]
MARSGAVKTLDELLRRHARPAGELAVPEPERGEGVLRCVACAHRCLLKPGRAGICKVRFNEDGRLFVPFGYVAGGLAVDPIEKKPFFHVLPGEGALSFGMLGCDLHCPYCQNWQTSQTIRDERAGSPILPIGPEQIVEAAARHGTRVVVSTYNEPLITAEWAAAVFDRARERGMLTGFVSNGNATDEVLDFLRPRMDLMKIDLKGFDDAAYRKLGTTLDRVLAGIRGAVERGFWVEIVTLVVPGFNDDDEQLRAIARFIAGLSRDIPWHVTAFHPDYRMQDRGATPPSTLMRAWQIGRDEGLRFVYTGNLRTGGRTESTWCPSCDALLVERTGWRVRIAGLRDGRCGRCGTTIPGVFSVPREGR